MHGHAGRKEHRTERIRCSNKNPLPGEEQHEEAKQHLFVSSFAPKSLRGGGGRGVGSTSIRDGGGRYYSSSSRPIGSSTARNNVVG